MNTIDHLYRNNRKVLAKFLQRTIPVRCDLYRTCFYLKEKDKALESRDEVRFTPTDSEINDRYFRGTYMNEMIKWR